jgi:ribosome-binding factor A
MPSQARTQRIAERIQEELSEMLLRDLEDPRLKGIFVTDVRVDRELSYADVFVSALEGLERSSEVLEGLDSASGFIRHALSAKIELRAFPRVRFHWDPTPENADRVERTLFELRRKGDSAR